MNRRHLSCLNQQIRCLVLLMLWVLQPVQALAADGQPFLWLIENADRPSYLFGTIHSGHPDLNRLPPSVEMAFADSDRYYGELKLDQATIAATVNLLQLDEGQRLSQLLSQPRQRRINRVLGELAPGIQLALFDRLKPWAFTVTLAMLEDQLRYGQRPAMDLRLYKRALASGKATGALETPAQQTQVFDGLSFNEQMIMLDSTLTAMEHSQAQQRPWMDLTYQAYHSGDPDQFNQLMEQQMPLPQALQDKLMRRLLTDRNQRMAQQIDQQLQRYPSQQLFFAVGAAHYDSKQGLQRLLQQRGYKVRRLD